jgi:hypothetical protein
MGHLGIKTFQTQDASAKENCKLKTVLPFLDLPCNPHLLLCPPQRKAHTHIITAKKGLSAVA